MNRCDGISDEKLASYRRTIRAMSRDSEIVLEDAEVRSNRPLWKRIFPMISMRM